MDRTRTRTIGPVGLGFLSIGLAGPSSDNSVAPLMKGTDYGWRCSPFCSDNCRQQRRAVPGYLEQSLAQAKRKSFVEAKAGPKRLVGAVVDYSTQWSRRRHLRLGVRELVCADPLSAGAGVSCRATPRYATSEQRTQSPIQLVGCPCQAVNPHVTGNYRNCILKINAPLVACRTSQGD